MVRQLTARKFEENIATKPKKQNTPTKACPRGPMRLRAAKAENPSTRIIAAMASRHETGVPGVSGKTGEVSVVVFTGASGDGAGRDIHSDFSHEISPARAA